MAWGFGGCYHRARDGVGSAAVACAGTERVDECSMLPLRLSTSLHFLPPCLFTSPTHTFLLPPSYL